MFDIFQASNRQIQVCCMDLAQKNKQKANSVLYVVLNKSD